MSARLSVAYSLEKKMKKSITGICIVVCAVLLCGCHRDEYRADAYVPKAEFSAKANEADGIKPSSGNGYFFTYNDMDIRVDADAKAVTDILGEPDTYFESPSCAAQGIGKLYGYGDFEIQTYPEGEDDRILYVMLKTDMVSTPEGIDISNNRDDVIAAYGNPTEENASSLIYEKDGMKLKFIFDTDDMISIEYDSPLA